MGDTSIRVSDEVKQRLEFEKREGESFDDVLRRLTQSDKWRGFGALAAEQEDTREGMGRVREELRSGFDADIEDSEDA